MFSGVIPEHWPRRAACRPAVAPWLWELVAGSGGVQSAVGMGVEELQRENASLREQQQAVGAVLGAVARAEGLQPVLDEVVEATVRLCEGMSAQLYLAEGGLLHAVAHFGQTKEEDRGLVYDREHPHLIDRTTIAGRTAATREITHIPDVEADAEYAYAGPRALIKAGLGVPILFEDELIGVVAVIREAPGPFLDDQIRLVHTFADQAAIAIANARLIDAVERQRTELARFVSPQVAELLSSDEGKRMLAGHRAYVSAMFFDLRGFTSFAELAEPEELFEVLGQYHRTLGELIPQFQGTLEHFAGDGVMVFFNDPLPVEQHELQAVRLALVAQEQFENLAASWRKLGHELGLGIGIAAGYATLGRVGFEGRYDYGAVGPVTNLASRLSTAAQPGQVLISQRVLAAVEDQVDALAVGEIELKGFGRPVPAFQVRSLATLREHS